MAATMRGGNVALAIIFLCFTCSNNVFLLRSSSASSPIDDFLRCLSGKIPAEQVFTQSSSGFMAELTSSVQNPRFVTNATVRPACIVAASDASHVQAAVRCGRRSGLGMTASDCHDLTWLRAMAFISLGAADAAPEGMLRRTNNLGTYVKSKSDYVRRPMGAAAWSALFSDHLASNNAGVLILEPHGGVVGAVIPDMATPYPHRAGVLYNIQYGVFWWGDAEGESSAAARRWLDALYAAMEAAVSGKPREAFVNYRDLDIGENAVVGGVTEYESARRWGERYFMGNFRRLAAVKGRVDPGDYFRNEQSIPPLLQPY
uniref:Berberine/berberine-like domain-containing protein n=1 Tax=Oryza barthii TaxID=65489 RepID=A0A0D3HM25_9ORYZ